MKLLISLFCFFVFIHSSVYGRDNYTAEAFCQYTSKLIKNKLKTELKKVSNTPYILTYRNSNISQIETDILRIGDITVGRWDKDLAVIFFYTDNKPDTHWTNYITSTKHQIIIPDKVPSKLLERSNKYNSITEPFYCITANDWWSKGGKQNLRIGIICSDSKLKALLIKWLNSLELEFEEIFQLK